MHILKNLRWFALAAAFGFAASAAQAEWITPNSIANPPAAVASANGTPVYANNLVNTQYVGLGLGFSSWTANTHLNGVAVWAPVVESTGAVPIPPPPITFGPTLITIIFRRIQRVSTRLRHGIQ